MALPPLIQGRTFRGCARGLVWMIFVSPSTVTPNFKCQRPSCPKLVWLEFVMKTTPKWITIFLRVVEPVSAQSNSWMSFPTVPSLCLSTFRSGNKSYVIPRNGCISGTEARSDHRYIHYLTVLRVRVRVKAPNLKIHPCMHEMDFRITCIWVLLGNKALVNIGISVPHCPALTVRWECGKKGMQSLGLGFRLFRAKAGT